MLARRLQDNCPRVLGHACASLTNHLENCNDPQNQLAPHIKELFTKLWEILEKGSCFVREHALSAISALSVGSGKEIFAPYYNNNMEKLLNIIENANDDQMKKLRGHAIECASITSKSCGREAFKPYSDRLVKLMTGVMNKINSSAAEVDDPQMGFLLSGWQRISGILKEEFYPYLEHLMPPLLQMCKTIIKNGTGYENEANPLQLDGEEPEAAKPKFNIYEDDNCFVAMNMIKIFL